MSIAQRNASHLALEYDWLEAVILHRIQALNAPGEGIPRPQAPAVPQLNGLHSPYSSFVDMQRLDADDRLLLLLALAPFLRPQVLEPFLEHRHAGGRPITAFGGSPHSHGPGFIPTGETALFVLAGDSLPERLAALDRLNSEQALFAQQHLQLRGTPPGEPWLQGILSPAPELITAFSAGRPYRPSHGDNFPARPLSTPLDWADLVIDDSTRRPLEELLAWVKHGHTILQDWGMVRHLKQGYRVLFHGPPGTGKTLTAALIGKQIGKPVYRIDLSMIVSKYIGETEKNLERLFTQAEDKDWILFFDEADALFGKRTRVKDAHDRYANQEVSYLLQRIEDFAGLVILASNNHDSIDEAFSRRFQAIVHFPMPKAAERLRLWQGNLPARVPLAPDVNLHRIAERYELSGGAMLNIVRLCALNAVRRDPPCITVQDFALGIQREYEKQGRMV